MLVSGIDVVTFKGSITGLTRAAFLEKYKIPFLVIEVHDERASSAFSTVLAEPGSPEAAAATAKPSNPFTPRLRLLFTLEKSERNNFADMISVGRTPNNDVVVADASVSKFHAYFKHEWPSGDYTVADGGSSNGTSIGDTKLPPRKPVALKSPTQIWFGPMVRGTFLSPEDAYAFLEGA